MPTTPPRRPSISSEAPATPDTPYHSVKENQTDVSDISDDDGSVDYFSDATEGRDRPSLEVPFGRNVNLAASLNTQFLPPGTQDEEDEDEEGAHTPHVEQAKISFPVPEIEALPSSLAVEERTTNSGDMEDRATSNSQEIITSPETQSDTSNGTTTQTSKLEEGLAGDTSSDVVSGTENSEVTGTETGRGTAPLPSFEPPIASTDETPEPPPVSLTEPPVGVIEQSEEEAGGDDFDDFDDFGETVEGDDAFDDFGDFDTAVEQPQEPFPEVAKIQPIAPLKPLLPDFTKMSDSDLKLEIDGIMLTLYPRESRGPFPPAPQPLSPSTGSFLTERSQSLWTQLCTPPPLQPPNWKLSRIRRLFLVSLGVPVDLDEILPAGTKQKKLVLPSSSSARKSSDNGARDGERRSSSRRRKDKDGTPQLVDVPSARILCSTSDVKLKAYSVEELQDHVKRLEDVTMEASETLTYWLGKRDTAMGDKKTFEDVIENLIVFAKKKR